MTGPVRDSFKQCHSAVRRLAVGAVVVATLVGALSLTAAGAGAATTAPKTSASAQYDQQKVIKPVCLQQKYAEARY